MNHSAENVFPLSGIYQAVTGDGTVHSMRLPGSLDENNIGTPGTEAEDGTIENGRYPYSRKYDQRGPVRISRHLSFEEAPEKRYFIDVERTRGLKLFVDEEEVLPESAGTLPAPRSFEVTGRISGAHMLTFVPDNEYPDRPEAELLQSNMASSATATNWNGLLGTIRIREEEPVFLENVRIRPSLTSAEVTAVINAPYRFSGEVVFSSRAFEAPVSVFVEGAAGRIEVRSGEIPLAEGVRFFDEGEGELYELKAAFEESVFRTPFGVRTFTAEKTGFLLNGRPFFLRGETSESLHPETAYPPMRKDAWTSIFRQYAAYGVNFVRFSSHCPPEAAFFAADECGMFLMPELSHDGIRTEPLTEEAKAYYRNELEEILDAFGNHPSFAAIGLPFSDGEEAFLQELKETVRKTCPDLLTAAAPGAGSKAADFVIRNYVPILYEPERPLVYDGIGPFTMLPDFREIDLFSGPLEPVKLIEYREKVRSRGHLALWEKYVEYSGEAALSRCKAAVEQAKCEPSVSGILLEGLQDVPGKRGKPSGMLTSHLVPKQYPFSRPERFRQFFGGTGLILRVKTHCHSFHDEREFPVFIVNQGKTALNGTLNYAVSDGEKTVSGAVADLTVLPGETKSVTLPAIRFSEFASENRVEAKLNVRLRFAGEEENVPLFVYADSVPICPENVYETPVLDLRAMEHLRNGGNVFLTPDLPSGERPVSQAIEKHHPVFSRFSTEEYTDERWENLSDRPGFLLPDRVKPIVKTLPDGENEEFTAQLFEARVFSGAVLVSSLGLKGKLDHPEAVALLSGIYEYMASYDFSPTREITIRELQEIVSSAKNRGAD